MAESMSRTHKLFTLLRNVLADSFFIYLQECIVFIVYSRLPTYYTPVYSPEEIFQCSIISLRIIILYLDSLRSFSVVFS